MKKYWYLIGLAALAAMPTPSCLNTKRPEQPMLETKRENPPNPHFDQVEKENETLKFDFPIIDGHYELSWQAFARTTFRQKYIDSVNSYAAVPTFPLGLKAYEGQKVMLRGYVIPVEETQDYQVLVLSAFPYTQCFFCGQAGPESIADVKLKNPSKSKRYARDTKTCFKGKLRLNDSDLNLFNFIIDEAEEVK